MLFSNYWSNPTVTNKINYTYNNHTKTGYFNLDGTHVSPYNLSIKHDSVSFKVPFSDSLYNHLKKLSSFDQNGLVSNYKKDFIYYNENLSMVFYGCMITELSTSEQSYNNLLDLEVSFCYDYLDNIIDNSAEWKRKQREKKLKRILDETIEE